MRLLITVLLCLLLGTLPSACVKKPPRILSADPASLTLAGRLVERHPLPPGWVLSEADSAETPPAAALSLERTAWSRGDTGSRSPGEFRLTVSQEVYAPAVFLWDTADNVESTELLRGGLRILPLGEIEPPLRALPVDGRYPGDGGYALTGRTELVLSGADEELGTWFSSLETILSESAWRGGCEEIIWIAAAGDIMPGRGVAELLLGSSEGPVKVFSDILPEMKKADLLLGNLEGAVTRTGNPAAKAYTFRFSPAVLSPLREAGFDYLSVTNNHAFDYGSGGFIDTLKNLAAAGIGTSGAGKNSAEAVIPWSADIRGLSVTVQSIAAYPVERSGWDGEKETRAAPDRPGMLWAGKSALEAVKSGTGGTTFDIVMVHGGEEWQNRPAKAQRDFYRSLVDSGADLVIGSHPHVLQGIEAYRGRPIVHSLGNFVFPGMEETLFGEESLLLLCGVYRGAVRYFRYVPVRINGTRILRDVTILPRFLSLTRLENSGTGTPR